MENIIKINYDSDFQLTDKVEYSNVPFTFKYFVGDDTEHVKTVSYDGTTYTGCSTLDGDTTHIVVYFDGNEFPCGNLRVRREFLIESAEYDDGIEHLVVVNHTNIYITECDGMSWASVYQDTDLPNFDAYTITSRSEAAISYINAKISEANSYIQAMIGLYDSVDDTLTSLTGYASYISYTKQWVDGFTESDPIFTASYAYNITGADIARWNSGANYTLPSYVVTADMLTSYVTNDALCNTLNSYVKTSTLDNYYTKTEQNNNLSYYATKNYVGQQLAGNVDQSNIGNYLSQYATTNTLNQRLSNYYTQSEMTTLLSNYPTNRNLSDKLSQYVSYTTFNTTLQQYPLKSTLNQYVTKDTLNNLTYATQAWVLQKMIDNYPEVDLSDYVTINALRSMDYLTVRDLMDGGVISVSLDGYVQVSEIEDKVIDSFGVLTSYNYASYIGLSYYAQTSYIQGWVEGKNYLTSESDPVFSASAAAQITTSMIDRWNNAAEPMNMSAYALKSEIPSLVGYATLADIPNMTSYALKTEIPSLTGYAKLTDIPSLGAYAKTTDLVNYVTWAGLNTELDDYATKEYVLLAIQDVDADVDLSNYATKNYVDSRISAYTAASYPDLTNYALKTDIPSLASYYTKTQVDEKIAVLNAKLPTLDNYYSKAQVNALLASYATTSYVTSYFAQFKILTQAQYDALTEYSPNTMYVISDATATQVYSKTEIDTKIGSIETVLQNILNN